VAGGMRQRFALPPVASVHGSITTHRKRFQNLFDIINNATRPDAGKGSKGWTVFDPPVYPIESTRHPASIARGKSPSAVSLTNLTH
jgi:hypothetical protein